MSDRAALRLAWGLAALALVLMLFSSVVSGLAVGDIFIWAIALVFAGVGALIAARHPDNAIGWIFLAAGVAAGLGAAAHSFADYWIDGNGGPAMLGKAAALYGEVSWIPFIVMPATFLLLLFPDGHLLSRRWRWAAWCAAAGMAGNFVAGGLRPGGIPDFPQIMNPIGVDSPLVELLEALSLLAVVIGVVGSSASLVVRFRRSRGEERQQMKWLALAGALAAATLPLALVTYDVIGETAANAAIMTSVLGLPAATGIAILRYRLYDIDVVINRTLVYGVVDGDPGRRLHRQRAPAAAHPERAHRGFRARGGRFDPRSGRPLPPGSHPHPGKRGPAVLPAQVRRAAHGRGPLGPPARRGRPRRARQRAARSRVGHHATRSRLALAAGAGGGAMSGRRAPVLAWAVFAVSAVVLAIAATLRILNGSASLTGGHDPGTAWFVVPVALLAASLVGALVASSFPRNPIGWMLCMGPLVLAITVATEQYATYVLVKNPGALPAGEEVLWFGHSVAPLGTFALFTFFFLLFPNGRLPSRRWRPVAWLAGFALGAILFGAFAPGTLLTSDDVENPFGAPGTAGEIVAAVYGLGWGLSLIAILASAVSLVVRFRHARGEERLQIKWVAFAAGLNALSFVATYTFLQEVWEDADPVVPILGLVAIPIAAAFAIFKRRLYDIDVVINRALVYGSLTAMLAGTYLGLVLFFQLVLAPLTEASGLAVAGSTLAVAARVPSRPRPYPGLGRSALLPSQVRRRADARALWCAAARRGRPRRARQRAARSRVRTPCSPLTSRCGYGRLRRRR